jgi:alkylation response protein AidB-like acyl-CoA dehydrogenase
MKKVHLLAAGAKAFATWHRTETASVCRQCVGGQGFSAYNKIAEVITGKAISAWSSSN